MSGPSRPVSGFVPLGDMAGAVELSDGRVLSPSAATPHARHHFTMLRQVNQLIEASEAEPDIGFMARLLALCSLPRTNPKQRVQYIRRNGPYKLIMQAGGRPGTAPVWEPAAFAPGVGLHRGRCGRNRASWSSAGRCTSSCNGSAWKIGAGGYT